MLAVVVREALPVGYVASEAGREGHGDHDVRVYI